MLPHFASQNNPLDVTGQAAVETEMYSGALEALANDPAVGLIAFDAFPPRLEDETPWADPVLASVKALRRATGVAFVSVAMSPLAYSAAAKAFTKAHDLPFLQGHHATAGAIRALVQLQTTKASATAADLPAHPNRPRALRVLKGRAGPIDEATGWRAPKNARWRRRPRRPRSPERSVSRPS